MSKKTKIGIAGAGGIGGYLIQYLYTFGTDRGQIDLSQLAIDVYDNDFVDSKNLLHQNFTQSDLGEMKADSLKTRYPMFEAKLEFMEESHFGDYDIIFSCVDSMAFRKKLYEYSWQHPKLFWIDGRCSSRNGAVLNSDLPKAELEMLINNEDKRAGCLLKYEKENDVSHTLPIIVGAMMVQTYLNHVRGEKTFKNLFRV